MITQNKKVGAQTGHVVSNETRQKIKIGILKAIKEGRKEKINSGTYKIGNKLIPQLELKRRKSHHNAVYRENASWWKGGNRTTAKKMVKDLGIKLDKCQICGDTKKIVIHHIDGNYFHNEPKNWGILCTYCHNAIHDTAKRKSTRFQRGHLPYTNKMPMDKLIN